MIGKIIAFLQTSKFKFVLLPTVIVGAIICTISLCVEFDPINAFYAAICTWGFFPIIWLTMCRIYSKDPDGRFIASLVTLPMFLSFFLLWVWDEILFNSLIGLFLTIIIIEIMATKNWSNGSVNTKKARDFKFRIWFEDGAYEIRFAKLSKKDCDSINYSIELGESINDCVELKPILNKVKKHFENELKRPIVDVMFISPD